MTTWAEDYDINSARSDCHAWGASPNIELFRTVLGVDTDAPGFSRVKIEPHLGTLQKAGGEIPHPQGKIAVNYELTNGKWKIGIILPGNLTGTLMWKDKVYPLKSGKNAMTL
jgi:alpha-L-rhamnosidase